MPVLATSCAVEVFLLLSMWLKHAFLGKVCSKSSAVCLDVMNASLLKAFTISLYTVRQLYNVTVFILTKIEAPTMMQCMPSMCPNFICNLATPQCPTLSMTGEIRRHVVHVVRGRGHSSDMEQRMNIKFCFKLGKTAAETVEMMRQVYGDNCLSRAQIFRWYGRFKSGVETIEDEARPGRPFSVRNEGGAVYKIME